MRRLPCRSVPSGTLPENPRTEIRGRQEMYDVVLKQHQNHYNIRKYKFQILMKNMLEILARNLTIKQKSGKIVEVALFIGSAANAVVDGQPEAVFRYGCHGDVFVAGQAIGQAQICKEVGRGLVQVAGQA